MIESAILNIGWIAFGAAIGAVIMFFVAQKNPEWVQGTYQKQRSASMQGTDKLAELQAKLDALELDRKVTEKVNEVISKLKG